ALAVSAAGAVGIVDLSEGFDTQGEVLNADANTSLIWARTVIPFVKGEIKKGEIRRVVTAVYALPGDEFAQGEVVAGWKEGWEARPSAWEALLKKAGWI